MFELLSDLNGWISEHQALVVTVGVPILTVASTAIISLVTTKANLEAQRRQRILQIETQLCQSRQIWIDSVREDLALASGLATRFETDFENTQLKSELVSVISRVRMKINPADPDDEELMKAFAKALGASEETHGWDENTEAIAHVGQRILKREWERLKLDLRAVERMP